MKVASLTYELEVQSHKFFDLNTIREHRRVWVDLQQELVALSSEGERRVAAGSGHVIQLDRPDMVIEAITGMRAALRAEVASK